MRTNASHAPFTVFQDIYKCPQPPIRITPYPEHRLTPDIIREFIASAPDGVIGLAPAYGRSCILSVLAFASAERVLVVSIDRSPQPKYNNNRPSGRVLLHDLILCAHTHRKIAFRMDVLATALFLDLGFRIAGGVDLLSAARPGDSRHSLSAMMTVLGGDAGVDKAKVIALFRHDEDVCAPEAHVALQAWAAWRAATLDARLLALAKLIREARRLGQIKPMRVENEIENDSFTYKEGKLSVTSTRFKTRILASHNQVGLQSSTVEGKVTKFSGKTVYVDGRAARIAGTSTLLAQPFFQALFLDAESPAWAGVARPPFDVELDYRHRKLNSSQKRAVRAMLSSNNADRVVLVQGPPGTGKTTVIAAAVVSILAWAHDVERTVWVVAQSNVAVKNIAEKLADVKCDFTLLVSREFHYDWHEHLYSNLVDKVLRSDDLTDDFLRIEERMQDSRVVLCTLSMFSNPKIATVARFAPVQTVMVDEASQVEIGSYLPLLASFGSSLQKMVFIGDDKQRTMPHQIGSFIGRHVYEGKLKTEHTISKQGCFFVDVEGGVEASKGRSWIAGRIALSQPYDAQRALLEAELKQAEIPWENKVFCVDSFQGNEADYIIISAVRTTKIGFMAEVRRVNVMLTRCKKRMVIFTNRGFVEGAGKESLVGAACS
ncbi:P-loop containing nucleoside triphosphate hydrolase protein [Mycena filopes]|nr:P-loop containing nucleoside triphosphate hydrolase protein [Mycena filopes]